MLKLKTLGLLIALPGVMMGAAAPASAQGEPKMCKVTVDRSQATGTYDVQRQELENGDCICYVYTGPQPQSDTIEQSIASLLENRQCPDAPLVAVPDAAAATTGGGGMGVALPLLGIAAAGGIAAAAASGGDDDSSSP